MMVLYSRIRPPDASSLAQQKATPAPSQKYQGIDRCSERLDAPHKKLDTRHTEVLQAENSYQQEHEHTADLAAVDASILPVCLS